MYKNSKFMAIIPARGGSKGLPKKNIKTLCGKPLIQWSIESALASKYIDNILVTTDSKEIADISKKCGAEVPFLRPFSLATDTATSVDVVIHAINFYKNTLKKSFDYIILIEPTSPLREIDDIDNMIEKIINNQDSYDSIISIGKVNEHPSITKKINEDNNLEPFCNSLTMTTRRQDDEKAFFPYGVAYIVKVPTFLKEKTFYTKRSTYYEIKRYQCYEIDDIYDFTAIEAILKYEKGYK